MRRILLTKKEEYLPDLILLKDGATINDLAKEIHSDLTKGSSLWKRFTI